MTPPMGKDSGEYAYSFAVEYNGPPVGYDIPRVVPIDADKIPVAAVFPQVLLSDNLVLPVVQPIKALDQFSKKFGSLGSDKSMVSPTSVIAFDRTSGSSGDCVSKELESGTETSVSPSSVIGFEEQGVDRLGCVESGELISSGGLEFLDGRYESSELSEVVPSSRDSGLGSVSQETSRELLAGIGSSGTVEFSGSFDKSRASTPQLRVLDGGKQSADFSEMNQVDWASNESMLSMDYPSSRVSSLEAVKSSTHSDGRRGPIVKFRDVETDYGIGDDYSLGEHNNVRSKSKAQNTGNKGSCYRCHKGNRFTEKEVCIVCDAKYCSNCVLRAMGSMPEGRKCVTCIGYPIDESKRTNLGRCSKMLKRLINDLEVQQIMKAEKLCEENQLPPEYVYVNGQPLSHEELLILQSCSNPPKKLKPGNYWYDKVSGLWGKEGEKPSQIISPHLNVGGPIGPDASSGNTQVFINGREITKVELRMLQLTGVQCANNPHFWVNDDGSYQEEGQKNTKGYIWGKAGTKLVCAFLSLPVPSRSTNTCGEQVNNLGNRSVLEYLEQVQKLLLVGCDGSGTSTIFKQAKILYKAVPFSEQERENIKWTIQCNVYGYLGILLEGRERFEEESFADMGKKYSSETACSEGNGETDINKSTYFIGPRLKAFSDWLLKTMVSGSLEAIFPAATREYAPVVEELWNNPAIRATYNRRSELDMLPSIAGYFLERAADILKADYEPSDLDILYAEGVTSSNGLACLDFSFPPLHDNDIDSADHHEISLRYELIQVHAKGLGENCKWLEMFEDVGLVIFCVSLTDYDQYVIDGDGSLVNKMLQGRKLFESIVTHPTFEQMDFLLILNKFDLFEEKIEQVPLTKCTWFDDFNPVVSSHRSNSRSTKINHNPTLGQLGVHYVAVKFKRLYSSLTGRKLHVSPLKGLEPESVDTTFKYAREILKWDEERVNFSLNDYSFYSTEASSH